MGWSATAEAGTLAFITGPNGTGIADLYSLLQPSSRMFLTYATVINNSGHVVAYSDVTVIPELEIYALLLAGLALVGFIARRKKMSGEAFSPG